MRFIWRPTLLCLTVYLSSLNWHSLAQNVIADTYLQVFQATGTTTFSTSGQRSSPSTRIVTNLSPIYAPCDPYFTTGRQIMTVIAGDYREIQIRDEPVLVVINPGAWTPVITASGVINHPPMTTNAAMTCAAVFTQLVWAYGTTTIFEEANTISSTIKINPTSLYRPIGPAWTTIRETMHHYVYAKYMQTQIRDEPILTSMADPPVGFTLTPTFYNIAYCDASHPPSTMTSSTETPTFKTSSPTSLTPTPPVPTIPRVQRLQAYGTTTFFEKADIRSESPIIKINPTRIYGPIGAEWATTSEIITVIVVAEYKLVHIIDEPILTSMRGPPAGFTLTPPIPCTPPPLAYMTSLSLETAVQTLTPRAQHPPASTTPTPMTPLTSSVTPVPHPTATPSWLLRTEL